MHPRPTSPIHELADQEFDVVVVGAGITGACIALDAATRGLRTALVDRADFGSGATTNCLRIVHGGLRYLQHLDVRRSRESIMERSMWLRSAPHLVDPLPVVMPTSNRRFPGKRALAAGLALNEALSSDRNDGIEPDRQIPGSRVLSRDECARMAPYAMAPGVNGGILFYDAIMYSPDRLTLDVIEAARRAGATTANYVEFVMPHDADGKITGCTLRDTLRGEDCAVRTRWIVNATGAASTELAQALAGSNAATRQAYSIAMNLVTGPNASSAAFTITGGAADPDRRLGAGGRQLFIVPWRGQRLIGTAHFPYDGSTTSPVLPDEYVERFLQELRSATPAMQVSRDDVRVVNWGLLPVSETRSDARVRLLKHHQILDHGATGGLHGAISVVSVKFTTARRLAGELVDRLTANRPMRPDPLVLPLPGRPKESYSALLRDALAKHAQDLPADVVEHLVRCYGANYERVIALAQTTDGGSQRVVSEAPVIYAQFLFGAREDQARTADDLLWRRTELGPRGLITPNARAMAEHALAAS